MSFFKSIETFKPSCSASKAKQTDNFGVDNGQRGMSYAFNCRSTARVHGIGSAICREFKDIHRVNERNDLSDRVSVGSQLGVQCFAHTPLLSNIDEM